MPYKAKSFKYSIQVISLELYLNSFLKHSYLIRIYISNFYKFFFISFYLAQGGNFLREAAVFFSISKKICLNIYEF